MKFFYRETPGAIWSQDFPTYIFVGRYTHLFNSMFNVWLTVSDRVKDSKALLRRGGSITPISGMKFLKTTGRRGLREILSDLFGRRIPVDGTPENILAFDSLMEPPRCGIGH